MSDSTNAGPGQMLDQEKCWTSTNIGMYKSWTVHTSDQYK